MFVTRLDQLPNTLLKLTETQRNLPNTHCQNNIEIYNESKSVYEAKMTRVVFPITAFKLFTDFEEKSTSLQSKGLK